MSLIKDLITAIRYYNSLDPYHRDVDNRPLNDLGTNQGVMADGLDTGLLSQKVVSAAAGFVARGLLGENMAVGKTEISGWTFKVKRLLAVMNKVASGTDSRLVPELSLWSEQLTPSGTGEGIFAVGQHATLYNMYSIRITTGLALTTKTPFYDATLSTYFPQVCEVQQAAFVLASSTSAVPPNEGAWTALGAVASDQLEVIRILVPPATLGVAPTIAGSMVTYKSYQEEGAFGSSGGGGTGDFLTLPRAKQYGLSNSGTGSADNLILVNPLTETDLDLATMAGVYGLNGSQVTSVLHSPVTEHTAQIGTWGPAVLRVVVCDVLLVQTLTMTRRLDNGTGVFYEAVEEWIRTKASSVWSAWDLVSATKESPIEVYDVALGKTVTLNRPSSNKAIITLIGAGGGGAGGGGHTGLDIKEGGFGGASGALLILEVEFNRDVNPSSALDIHVGRTTYGGAGAIAVIDYGFDGVDGDDTYLRFSGHEIRVPGGNGGQKGHYYNNSYGDARMSVTANRPPAGGAVCTRPSEVAVNSVLDFREHRVRWPTWKPYYASTLYTQSATAQEVFDKHMPMTLKTGDVIDLWEEAGARIKVLNSIPTLRAYTHPFVSWNALTSVYKYVFSTDGTPGGVVHPSIPSSAYAAYLAFDPYSPEFLAANVTSLWGTRATLEEAWRNPKSLVDDTGSRNIYYMAAGTRVGVDFVNGAGLPAPAKGGFGGYHTPAPGQPYTAGIGYGLVGVHHASQVETNGYGQGEHAPATAWGYGGGGGASSSNDPGVAHTAPSSGHTYTDPEDTGVGGSGLPIPGTYQRAYPGGRGAAGYASIKPLI